MSTSSQYIPAQDAKFDDFQIDFVTVVTANAVAWGIGAAELVPVTAAQTVWTAAWAVAKNKDNRTIAQITAKKLARKNYEAVMRPFIQTRIYRNPLMSNADLLLCGIRPHDSVRTPVPKPAGVPEITVVNRPGNTVSVYFNPPKGEDGSTLRGKPKGVTGLLVVYQMGGNPPTSPKQCSSSATLTRSPKRIVFQPDEAGQRIYLFGCWVNGKGEQGSWTSLNQFLIP